MTTLDQLQRVFCNNFTTYYASHVAHVNIVGRTFVSDHELLKGIYEDRQDQIDTIAEIIRTLKGFMIDSVQGVIAQASIEDVPTMGSSDVLLTKIAVMIEDLIDDFKDLQSISEKEDLNHISNYAQDQVSALEKQLWMLRSTLD